MTLLKFPFQLYHKKEHISPNPNIPMVNKPGLGKRRLKRCREGLDFKAKINK